MQHEARWTPRMFPKQFDVFNCAITAPPEDALTITPAVLLSGGRLTGKTIAIVHRIMRHLWEVPGARVAVFTKTMKVAKDGGVWIDLLDGVEEWTNAGMVGKHGHPFAYTSRDSSKKPGPKIDSQTRTISFKVRNWHGGESELKLFSLEHDHEVEAKVKGTRFSMMWFSELSNFGDRRVFDVSTLQLRMKHLKPWQHMWIADTNPHEDGEDHWIFKVWYKDRIKTEAVLTEEIEKRGITGDKVAKELRNKLAYRDSLRLIEILLDDNTFLDEGQRVKLISLYEDDPGEYARNVEGKWVKGHGNIGCHFADVFIPNFHVVGSSDPNVGDAIDLLPSTFELIGGWDLGTSINHSAHILEQRFIDNICYWMVHDEIVSIGERISTTDFTLEYMDKMTSFEERYGRAFHWRFWSDDSSDVWRSAGEGGTDAMEVETVSRGRIMLEPVRKPQYSVRARVKFLRQLLFHRRIFVAARCVRTIEMLLHCSKGSSETEYVAKNQYKHVFDSLTYPIYMEALNDPESAFLIGQPRPKSTTRDVAFI